MDHLKVEGYSHLYRDAKTNSIVNKNMTEYNEYISRKNIKNKESMKLVDIETDIDNIKSDINEIKFLLKELINGSR